MYAIVQVGGRQYRATPGDRLVVDRMEVEPGSELQLPDVRMVVAESGDSEATQVGRPRLEDVFVAATAVSHFRGPKLLVFKYKPKKRYRRKRGFRAELTELRIDGISLGSAGAPKEPVDSAPKAVTKAPARRSPAAKADASAGAGEPGATAGPVAAASKPRRAARAKASVSESAAELPGGSEESGDGA
ncbi:MAG TPA: 50S ribosomal protein L21 [Candidatus Nanopelagicaceae bacterium]|nr:50S ribosomal protein L21 [Candidatus Nanopelagicaceae bacterium]